MSAYLHRRFVAGRRARRALADAAAFAVVPAVVLALLLTTARPVSAAGQQPPAEWSRPVDGVVLHPFAAPANRYAPGHRGVDLAADAGTLVRAAGDGRVGFAGDVAGARHVVVQHAGDLRTGYSYLDEVRVVTGQMVRRGDVLGTAGGVVDGNHAPGDFHFSVRKGDAYLDPMLLFAPVDLARVVRLAPLDDAITGPLVVRDPASEARDLVALEAVGAPAAAAVREIAAAAGRLPGDRPCTADAGAATGGGGSGHALMVVGGIDSSWNGTGNVLGLPADDLGYEPSEVQSFSYDGEGAYAADATWRSIADAAIELDRQLRERQREHPGREVDLIAHSQGGVVVDVFLQKRYRFGDAGLPPIGTVVTLASPHQGAPLATASQRADASALGNGAHGALAEGFALPPPDAAAVRDLAEGSDLLRSLWDHRLPDQIDFTSIAAVDDLVVPSGATKVPLPGVEYALTDPAGLLADHSHIRDDASAMRAVRLALEGKAPPCTSTAMRLRAGIESEVITRVERGAGLLAGAAGRVVDALRG